MVTADSKVPVNAPFVPLATPTTLVPSLARLPAGGGNCITNGVSDCLSVMRGDRCLCPVGFDAFAVGKGRRIVDQQLQQCARRIAEGAHSNAGIGDMAVSDHASDNTSTTRAIRSQAVLTMVQQGY